MIGREKGTRIGPYGRLGESERGAWLNNARVDADLTMAEFSALSGTSIRTIQSIESGSVGAGYRSSWKIQKTIAWLKAQSRSTLRDLFEDLKRRPLDPAGLHIWRSQIVQYRSTAGK